MSKCKLSVCKHCSMQFKSGGRGKGRYCSKKCHLLFHIDVRENGCWTWDSVRPNGYGIFGHQNAHRVVYEVFRNRIPEGLCACHTCDNKACVNPDHIFVGTHTENMRDMLKKGRRKVKSGIEHFNSEFDSDSISKVIEMRMSGTTVKKIARSFSVSQTTIKLILSGKTYKDVDRPVVSMKRVAVMVA